MRVVVRLGNGREATYTAPDDTRVGDRVVVLFGRDWPKVVEGDVTEVTSDYAGEAREINHRCRGKA